MNGTSIIQENDIIYAHIYNGSELNKAGVSFLTPETYPLQIGVIQHPENYNVKAHRHADFNYEVNTTQEFIYIEKGKIEITVYRNDWSVIEKKVLAAGDFVLFTSGGHSLKTLEPSRLIEVKQGPYPGDAKAKIFKQ